MPWSEANETKSNSVFTGAEIIRMLKVGLGPERSAYFKINAQYQDIESLLKGCDGGEFCSDRRLG